ncbi:MAG: hypothetical protein AAGA34_01185 [Pseudomonadota bacterium]
MSELKPHFTILIDERRREVHYAASGFWTGEDMARFQSALLKKAKPLIDAGEGFRVMGDMSGLAVQDRRMADAMRFMMAESAKLGMKRQAFVITAPLLKMQFDRLVDGTNTQIFANKGDAVAWIRRPE